MYGQEERLHSVKKGETLSSIAALYGITEDELRNANKDNVDMLFQGLVLVIPKVEKKESDTLSESNHNSTLSEYMADSISMTNGSYVLCKVEGIKNGKISLRQEEHGSLLFLPITNVHAIYYINGKVRKFK